MEKFLELTEHQLNYLRDEFIETDGLSVQQFVGVMLKLLPPVDRDERLHLVYQLADLFAQVDINGDGTMEFDEFTLFFISAGMTKNEFKPRLSFTFQQHAHFEHKTKHRMSIHKLVFLAPLQKVVALESSTGDIAIYNAASPEVADGMSLVCRLSVNVGDERGTTAQDIVYVPEFCVLVVALSSFALNVYDATGLLPSRQYFKQLSHIKAAREAEVLGKALGTGGDLLDANGVLRLDDPPEMEEVMRGLACAPALLAAQHTSTPQDRLAWHHDKQELLSCGTEPMIYRWHMEGAMHAWKGKTITLRPCGVLDTGHTDQVRGLKLVPLTNPLGRYPNALASSASAAPVVKATGMSRATDDVLVSVGSDHRFCVWRWGDRGVTLACRKLEHTKAVQLVEHIPQNDIVLTAGFDHFVQAWDLNLDDGSPVFRLPHHEGGVVGLHVLPGRPQAVSVDARGLFKWWDCTNGTNLGDTDRLLQVFQPDSFASIEYPARGLVCIPPFQDMEMWANGAPIGPLSQRLGRLGDVVDVGALTDEELAELDRAAAAAAGVSRAGPQVAAKTKGAVRSQGDATETTEVGCGAVVGCGPRLKAFELMRTTDSRSDPAGATFSAVTAEVYVVVESDLKVFDAVTGGPKRLYKNVMGANITVMRMDGGGRKMMVGTAVGRATVLNAYTGCMITDMPNHGHEVTVMLSSHADHVIISMAKDGVIRMCDELFEDEGEGGPGSSSDDEDEPASGAGDTSYEARVAQLLAEEATLQPSKAAERGVTEVNLASTEGGNPQMILREIRHAHGSEAICAGAYSYELGMLASADALGRVRLWDFVTAAFLGEGVAHSAPITGMVFLFPLPVLVTADAAGQLCMWDIRTPATPHECLPCLVATSTHHLVVHPAAADAAATHSADGIACLTRLLRSAGDGGDMCPLLALGTDSGDVAVLDPFSVLAHLPHATPVPQGPDYSPHLRRRQTRTGGRGCPDLPRLRAAGNGAFEKLQPCRPAYQAGEALATVARWQVVRGAAVRSIEGGQGTDSPVLITTDSLGGLCVFAADPQDMGTMGHMLCYLHTSAATAKPPLPEDWRFPLDPDAQLRRHLADAAVLLEEVEALGASDDEGSDVDSGEDDGRPDTAGTTATTLMGRSENRGVVAAMQQVRDAAAGHGVNGGLMKVDTSEEEALLEAVHIRAKAVQAAGRLGSADPGDTAALQRARARKDIFAQYLLEAVTWEESAADTLKAEVRGALEARLAELEEEAFGKTTAQQLASSQQGPGSPLSRLHRPPAPDDAASVTSALSGVTYMNLQEIKAFEEADAEEAARADNVAELNGATGGNISRVDGIMALLAQRREADGEVRGGPAKVQHDSLIGARLGAVNTTRASIACCTSKAARRRGTIEAGEVVGDFAPATFKLLYPHLTAMQGSSTKMGKARSSGQPGMLSPTQQVALDRLRLRTDAAMAASPSARKAAGAPRTRQSSISRRGQRPITGLSLASMGSLGSPLRVAGSSSLGSPTSHLARLSAPRSRGQLGHSSHLHSPAAEALDGICAAARALRKHSMAPMRQSPPLDGPGAHLEGVSWDIAGPGFQAAHLYAAPTAVAKSAVITAAYHGGLLPPDAAPYRPPRARRGRRRKGGAKDVYRSVADEELFKYAEAEVQADHERAAGIQASMRASLVASVALQVSDPGLVEVPADVKAAKLASALTQLPMKAVQEAAEQARGNIRSTKEVVKQRAAALQRMQRQLHDAHVLGTATSTSGEDRLDGRVLARRRMFGVYTRDELDFFKDVFRGMDVDGNGQVSLVEFLADPDLGSSPAEQKHYQSLFEAADRDKDGSLSLEEYLPIIFPAGERIVWEEMAAWVRYTEPPRPPPKPVKRTFAPEVVAKLQELFKVLDVDGNGSISLGELQEGIQEAREVYYSAKAAGVEVQGHTLAPMLDDTLRELALEAAKRELLAEQKEKADAIKKAAEAAVKAAAAPAAKPPKARPAATPAGEHAEKGTVPREPPALALMGKSTKASTAEAEEVAKAEAKRAATRKKSDFAVVDMKPQFMQALRQQKELFGTHGSPRKSPKHRRPSVLDAPPTAHATDELSLAEFIQMLGPTFSVTKNLTAAQRRAASILEQLQQR